MQLAFQSLRVHRTYASASKIYAVYMCVRTRNYAGTYYLERARF